ncbi:hypothetical protein [Sphingomonas sp.]|jgi:hypothetical protein|uniref:hypothetical protein n=1 Tax=Sphingomonas sp. TaxID=28214 RepID=UPI002E0E0455|nr:hypothetical protein [Sphingomonas sp.]
MTRLSDFHGIGPLADRPSAAAAHALRADASHLALTWTDSGTGTLYGLNLAGTGWMAIGGGGGGGVSTFAALSDTPAGYAGQANKLLRVNAGANAVEFAQAVFAMLAEAPAGAFSLGANKMLVGNEAGTAFEWRTPPAGLSGPSLVLSPPELTAGNNYVTVIIDSPKASGLINSNGGDDGVSCRLIQNASRVTNGPTSQPNYYNVVFGLGYNSTPAFTPSNTAMPSASFRIESKFAQGGPSDPFMAEFHASLFPASDPSIEFRALSATVPHLIADWNGAGASYSMRSNNFRFISGIGTDRLSFRFGGMGNEVEFIDSGAGLPHPKLFFGTNNRPTVEQWNAAKTGLLPAPYRNSNDNTHIGGGALYIVGTAQATPSGSGNCGIDLNITSGGAAGMRGVNVQMPAVTGDAYGAFINASGVTGRVDFHVLSTTGKPTFNLQTGDNASSDMMLCFTNQGSGASFTIGYDNSDGDKLKVEKSFKSVGSSSALFFECDPAINVTRFAMPPKLPSYTVAGLPAAATVGAGSKAYVTDLNATTAASVAAGGGSNKGEVICDGTNWRIVVAWA